MTERYIVRIGKFGAYFYDMKLMKNMTLEDVAYRLNYYDRELHMELKLTE